MPRVKNVRNILRGFHNLDSVLKSKDIILLTQVHIVKALVLPAVKQGCEKERKWKSLSRVWLFATPWTNYTVHGILQARILEWVAYPISSGSSWSRNQTRVSCIAGGFFTNWAIREPQECDGWTIKKPDHHWCFQIVVPEKTPKSPLDCKESKAVNPKGNQSWILIGRTDSEAEVLILRPSNVKSQLIVKDPDAGKDWSQEEKKAAEDEAVASLTVDVNLGKLWETVRNREVWPVAVHGVKRLGRDLVTEQ